MVRRVPEVRGVGEHDRREAFIPEAAVVGTLQVDQQRAGRLSRRQLDALHGEPGRAGLGFERIREGGERIAANPRDEVASVAVVRDRGRDAYVKLLCGRGLRGFSRPGSC